MKQVVACIKITFENRYPRIFADVEIQGIKIKGLLDNGASVGN